VLLLTSKGAAAVTGGGFITLAATFAAMPSICLLDVPDSEGKLFRKEIVERTRSTITRGIEREASSRSRGPVPQSPARTTKQASGFDSCTRGA